MSEFSKKLTNKLEKSKQENQSQRGEEFSRSRKSKPIAISIIAIFAFGFAISAYAAVVVYRNIELKKILEVKLAIEKETQAKLVLDTQQKAPSDAQAEIDLLEEVVSTTTQALKDVRDVSLKSKPTATVVQNKKVTILHKQNSSSVTPPTLPNIASSGSSSSSPRT